MEIYKAIRGYPKYKVSNHGNVMNTVTGRVLKSCMNGIGYYYVRLCADGPPISKAVHQLVAKAFIRNPNDHVCVDHKDSDKSNNHRNNLRWCTYQQNGQNKKMSINNTSGCKGVTIHKNTGKYQASIRVNGVNKYIGVYETLGEAKQARLREATLHFGEFMNACEL